MAGRSPLSGTGRPPGSRQSPDWSARCPGRGTRSPRTSWHPPWSGSGAHRGGLCGGGRLPTYTAIAEWVADLPADTAVLLGIDPDRRSPEAMIRRLLQALDPDLLAAAIGAWLAARIAPPVPGARQAIATSPVPARCCTPGLRWRCGEGTTRPPKRCGNSSRNWSPTRSRCAGWVRDVDELHPQLGLSSRPSMTGSLVRMTSENRDARQAEAGLVGSIAPTQGRRLSREGA